MTTTPAQRAIAVRDAEAWLEQHDALTATDRVGFGSASFHIRQLLAALAAPPAGDGQPTSADDVLFMLGEAASRDTGEPTRQMAEEIWALMDGATLFSLAVRAWERGNAVVAARALTAAPGPTRWQTDTDPSLPPLEQAAEALRQKVEQEHREQAVRAAFKAGQASVRVTAAPGDGPAALVALRLVLKCAERACDSDNIDAAIDYVREALRHIEKLTPATPSAPTAMPPTMPEIQVGDWVELDGTGPCVVTDDSVQWWNRVLAAGETTLEIRRTPLWRRERP